MLKLFRYLKPYAAMVAGVFALVFLQTLADLYLPSLMGSIINHAISGKGTTSIWQTGFRMVIITFLGMGCAIGSCLLASRATTGFGKDLRRQLFHQVMGFNLQEFDRIGTSTLITRTTNDVTQVQNVLFLILRIMLAAPLMMFGGILMAFYEDSSLTLILLLAVPVLAGVIAIIAGRATPLFRSMQGKIDHMNLILREKLTGTRVIRAFNRTTHERERFENANRDLTQNYIRVNIIMAFMIPAIQTVMSCTMMAVLWFGALRVDSGQTRIGSLIAFIQYGMMIMFSLLMLSMVFVMIPRASAASSRILEVLDSTALEEDPKECISPEMAKGNVEFRNVSFRYPGAEQPALNGISFQARPGEMTAIIGSTGAGKTTLLHLLLRFHDVESGSILIDGHDVNHLRRMDLRNLMGLVPQQPSLFSGTVAHNIRIGREDASDDEVRHAAEVAQAMEFIENLPDGMEHSLEQGGANLSGGQKQRLAIARVLVRRPVIYLFDDSFSALDFQTDARLRTALRGETAQATVLIVAQRVGTIMNADRIIVLDEGRLAGTGTHSELLETCRIYREIVSSQLTEEEIA